MKMARDDFKSWEGYEAFLGACETNGLDMSERVSVLTVGDGWMRCDLITHCRSWRTALKRFFSVLSEPVFSGWFESMWDACECGAFCGNDHVPGKPYDEVSWAYGVERLDDGVWYIYLNVRQ